MIALRTVGGGGVVRGQAQPPSQNGNLYQEHRGRGYHIRACLISHLLLRRIVSSAPSPTMLIAYPHCAFVQQYSDSLCAFSYDS
jgi:hypothetical protein